jgi:hypothetical protein
LITAPRNEPKAKPLGLVGLADQEAPGRPQFTEQRREKSWIENVFDIDLTVLDGLERCTACPNAANGGTT